MDQDEATQPVNQAPVESETTVSDSHLNNKTPGDSQQFGRQHEKTVPYQRFAETNKLLRETQRKLAEYESQQKMLGYSDQDIDQLIQHPFVQDLLIKQAKVELTDFARQILDQYKGIHPQVKKAILANVRGFVKESTTDVEAAKLDIQEYIESILENEDVSQPDEPKPQKGFPVASSNAMQAAQQEGATPAEIRRILAKSPMDMTPEELAKLESYKNSQ